MKKSIADLRRSVLQSLVDQFGAAEITRRTGKPGNQISDMIHGRKSFGEKVAEDIEKGFPERPPGWLMWPGQSPARGADKQEEDAPIPEEMIKLFSKYSQGLIKDRDAASAKVEELMRTIQYKDRQVSECRERSSRLWSTCLVAREFVRACQSGDVTDQQIKQMKEALTAIDLDPEKSPALTPMNLF